MKVENGVVRSGEVYYNGKWHSGEWTHGLKNGIINCDHVSKQETGKEIVITCGAEGRHSRNSKHPKFMAVDLRTWIYTEAEKELLMLKWNERLNPEYDCDKKKGQKNYDIIWEGKKKYDKDGKLIKSKVDEHFHLEEIGRASCRERV